MSIARLTKQQKLVPDISSKSVPFVPSHEDGKRNENLFNVTFQFEKYFGNVCWLPHAGTAWYKRDGFTGNIWHKLWFLGQPSYTRTNIPKHGSGPIN